MMNKEEKEGCCYLAELSLALTTASRSFWGVTVCFD